MKIVILGVDPRSEAIERLLVDAGYTVRLGSADAAGCDMLIFAGSREHMDDLLAQAGRVSPSTTVVDAMDSAPPGGASGSELLARRLDTRRIVRVLIMAPQVGAHILCCGDDADAKKMVNDLFRTAGCIATDRGPLANAAEIEAPPSATSQSSFETLKSANSVGSM
jgi:predicted dinucleotide-binding enzyme